MLSLCRPLGQACSSSSDHATLFSRPSARLCGCSQRLHQSTACSTLAATVCTEPVPRKTNQPFSYTTQTSSQPQQPQPGPCSPPAFEDAYVLGPELGKGCFATCFEVTERATGRAFCAKRLPKTRLRHTAVQCRAAIDSEVKILRQLQGCPDVLRLHGVADAPDAVYIITELCTGGTLLDLLKEAGHLSEKQTALAMRTVLSAIVACHAAGIEYGDLKPTNVLLRRPAADSDAKLDLALADFGCAQYVDARGHATSSPGTPLFVAPEVMFHRNGLEADMWSAGVLLYHMLSGQWPFFGPEENLSPNSVMRRALSAPILWGSPVWKEVSPGAIRLIEQMLQRDKSSRITAKEALHHPWILENTLGEDYPAAAEREE